MSKKPIFGWGHQVTMGDLGNNCLEMKWCHLRLTTVPFLEILKGLSCQDDMCFSKRGCRLLPSGPPVMGNEVAHVTGGGTGSLKV